MGGDEDDRDSGLSPEGSSDNDQDGHGEDMDMDIDGDLDNDGDGENEDEDNEDEDDEQDQDDSQYSFGYNRPPAKAPPKSHAVVLNSISGSTQAPLGSGVAPSSAPTSHPNPAVLLTSTSQNPATSVETAATDGPKIRHEILTAPVYDIVPTIAAPHSTSINSITATPDLRWVFSGGADGYIRKFNWIETANGKAMLTVAQRHPFVDSVTKAGVLMSYWENEDSHAKPSSGDDGSSLSSVYSLAVHREGLWLLSGLESGGINLQSVRHDEGKLITCLRSHTSAVSVLNLAQDERSVLSGSWDKTVIDWDLNTGKIKRSFEGSGGQISALEIRPLSSLPVPEASGEIVHSNDTFSSDNSSKPRTNGILTNGAVSNTQPGSQDAAEDAGSPTDSLFGGGNDSLFGDNDDGEVGAPSGGNFVDDDDDFSRAIAKGIQEQENEDAEGDVDTLKAGGETTGYSINGASDLKHGSEPGGLGDASGSREPASSSLANGLSHAEELCRNDTGANASASGLPDATSISDSIFLAASIDGSLRVWDKRQSAAIAKITPRNVPPWCMNACWSPDGNFIYAGRRNGTVEEFSLHKGLRGVERSLKLPNGSGAVSAVRAMPNGRHLVCASYDILRLYDLQQQQTFKHSTVPFLIVPGHRTGVVSQLYVDPSCRYMISTAGNRGWEGSSTEVLLGYEIGVGK